MPSIRLDLAMAAILAIVAALFWWHHTTIVTEDRRLELAQSKAVQAAKDEVNKQSLEDAKNAALAIDNLQSQLDILRTSVPRTAPVMRLCGYANSPGALPPARGTTGQTPSGTPDAGGLRGVPTGDPGGLDVGTVLFDLAYSGALEAAYRSATVKWALEQGK